MLAAGWTDDDGKPHEREAERERRERAWQEERAARLKQRREQLAAGKLVRCVCCGGPVETEAEAVEKHGTLVHVGDCEHEWGSELDAEEAA